MTSDGLLVLTCVFQTILRLFNSWYIPGTHTTPLEFGVFSVTFYFGLKLFKNYLLARGE